MKLSNIFKQENFTTYEYYTKENITKDTERLKINVLNENEIIAEIDFTGKDLPTFLLGKLKLPKNESGEVTFLVETIGKATLSCLNLSTNSNEIGRNIKLYKEKDVMTLNLKEDDYIAFKFTYYTNYDRAGKISIKCI